MPGGLPQRSGAAVDIMLMGPDLILDADYEGMHVTFNQHFWGERRLRAERSSAYTFMPSIPP
jgi:hypothetical protein